MGRYELGSSDGFTGFVYHDHSKTCLDNFFRFAGFRNNQVQGKKKDNLLFLNLIELSLGTLLIDVVWSP